MSLLTFRKVRCANRSDGLAINVTLFRDDLGRVCGWYIGPLRFSSNGGVTMPYLPRSERTLAAVAVIRAIELAEEADVAICIVDPHDLWEPAWA